MSLLSNIWNRINNSMFNNFSARDKRQVLTFFLVIMAIFAVNFVVNHIRRNTPTTFSPEINEKLDLLDQRLNELQEGDTLSRLDRYIVQRYDTLQLFDFDPNTATINELIKLGFTEKQANNLANYRNNGGKFRTPDDLRKLYGMRTMQFKILKPYIVIAASQTTAENKNQHQKLDEKNAENYTKTTTEKPSETPQKEYFNFDPNTITAEESQRLGFSEKQAESFIKWRDKGKKFYVAKDFASTFFVDAKRYQELEPYIKIDLEKLFNGKKLLDINTATDTDLRAIGLSADEATRVIDFREKVGYYFANWQIEDALTNKKRANELKSNFYVCASVEIRKININTITLDNLEKHPYFSAQQAAATIKLRETQKINSIEDLKKTNLFTDKELNRIKNYLTY